MDRGARNRKDLMTTLTVKQKSLRTKMAATLVFRQGRIARPKLKRKIGYEDVQVHAARNKLRRLHIDDDMESTTGDGTEEGNEGSANTD